jgi:CheY-like chemotaxis protein
MAAKSIGAELPEIAHQPGSGIPAQYCSPEVFQSIFGLLAHVCFIQTQHQENVSVQERPFTNGLDLALRFQMSSVFSVIFKEMLAGQEPLLNPRTIERAPDALVTMLLAQKLAARYFIKIWMQLEERDLISVHTIFDTSVKMNDGAKDAPLVLVIEDTKPIGLLMEMYLHMAGFQTILANDGIAGLEMAREQQPDLITLDVMMPRMDGWQVLSRLKSDPATSAIPVIIVSVLKDRQVGFEHGASEYLPKPVVRENLIASARRLTSPIKRVRRTFQRGLTSAVYLSTDPVLSDDVAAAFPAGSLRYCATGAPSVIEEILSAAEQPDLFIVDCDDEFDKVLTTIFRLRLIDALDTIPIVAIGGRERLDYLKIIGHDIVDGVYLPKECTREKLVADFMDRNPE